MTNAQAFLRIMENGPGSFADFLWKHVVHAPVVNHWTEMQQVPARTAVTDALSRDLKKAGFSCVGSTIVHAFMQATGMVVDHLVSCWRLTGAR
jgi:DNA-3-methyladenine glycosylase I